MKKSISPQQEEEIVNKTGIDWSNYLQTRLSEEQYESGDSFLDEDDEELEEYAWSLLENARVFYEEREEFRDRRKECRDFYKGNHWNEKMIHPETRETITQEEWIREQGMLPIKQNQIRQIVKNMLGQYRDNENDNMVISRDRNKQQEGEMMTKALQYALQFNKAKELDVRMLEEFCLSGYCNWKTSYRYISKRDIEDVWIDPVHPNRFFHNTGLLDIRMTELYLCGEFIDMRLEDVISNFAKTEEQAERIRQLYGRDAESNTHKMRASYGMSSQDSRMVDDLDFYIPEDPSMCRVFEIWEKINTKVYFVHDTYHGSTFTTTDLEELEQTNKDRISEAAMYGISPEDAPLLEWEQRYEDIWHFWFLTPDAKVLYHGETPYDHQEHPYTLGLYPLVDGNVWGLVYDILDQQKQINRLLVMLDKIIGDSAKGVLLVPEDCIPDGWDIDMFADEWTKSNGVIKYKPSKTHPNIKPEQVSANSTNIGAIELLQVQFNLLREISGISDAIQGQKPSANTPASLYAQQTNNAALNNRDYFDSFYSVRQERDFKVVKLQQQFYEEDRRIIISGQEFDNTNDYYEVDRVKDIDFDMAMGPGMNSTVYRQVYEEGLFKLLEMQLIDRDVYLKTTSQPFADRLRSALNEQQQELQAMQQNGEMADPRAMQLMNQYLGMGQGQMPAA